MERNKQNMITNKKSRKMPAATERQQNLGQAMRAARLAIVVGGSTIQMIPITSLFIDHSYQRDLKDSWVRKTQKEFEPSVLGVIYVSQRPDGTYAIVDGQHRFELCRLMGRSEMRCEVHTGLTVEDEANLFFLYNEKRSNVAALDVHKALSAGGNAEALALDVLVGRHGYVIRRGLVSGGKISWVCALQKVYRHYGDAILSRALGAIVQIDPKELSINTMTAFCDVLKRGVSINEKDIQKFQKQASFLKTLEDELRDFTIATTKSKRGNAEFTPQRGALLGRILFDHLNKGRRTNRRETPQAYAV